MKLISKYYALSAVWLLLLQLAAAPAADAQTKTGGQKSPTAPVNKAAWTDAPARPLNLTANLDEKNASSAVITKTGGTLFATGSDGTRYVLTIPPDALRSDERITMTPVRSFGNFPLKDGMAAAVQIEPEGLRLVKPAVLRIEPAQEIPVAQQTSFAYYNRGDDAHLYPLAPDPRKIEFRLAHFSGYGIGRAASDDPGLQALRQAGSVEARLASRMQEFFRQSREEQLNGKPLTNFEPQLVELFIEYYDAVVKPLLRIAETDDRMAECAVDRLFDWDRENQLIISRSIIDNKATELGKRRAEGEILLHKIWKNMYEKRYARALQRCRTEHDFSTVGEILELERLRQIMRFEVSLPTDAASISADFRKCFSFEVEFDSSFNNGFPGGEFAYQVRSKMPVSFNPFDLAQTGRAAPLEYVKFTARGNVGAAILGTQSDSVGGAIMQRLGSGDVSAAGTKPDQLAVLSIDFNENVRDIAGTDCKGQDETRKKRIFETVSLLLSVGTPEEMMKVKNPATGIVTDLTTNHWANHWARARRRMIYDPNRGAREQIQKLFLENAKNPEKLREILANPDQQALLKQPKRERDDDETRSAIYQIELKLISPGVWQADFTFADNAGVNGWTLSEKSSVILRHTPQ